MQPASHRASHTRTESAQSHGYSVKALTLQSRLQPATPLLRGRSLTTEAWLRCGGSGAKCEHRGMENAFDIIL